jgi:hypothetical protein
MGWGRRRLGGVKNRDLASTQFRDLASQHQTNHGVPRWLPLKGFWAELAGDYRSAFREDGGESDTLVGNTRGE